MKSSKHKIAIVLRDITEGNLLCLLERGDVWMVDTEQNRQAFASILASNDVFSFPGNLTKFTIRHATIVDQLSEVFETLFDHYNEYTFSGDWDELLVVGVAASEDVRRALGGEFDERIIQTPPGVKVVKSQTA